MAYPPPLPPAPVKKENQAVQIGIFIALAIILLFVLMYFRVVPCNSIHPAACDAYYSIVAGGKPRVLIVNGTEGMGDPQKLFDVLKSPQFSARVSMRELEVVSLPVLLDNQLVIVERAKVMSLDELKMFEDYVNRGGKLIWIGDAGTAAPETESDSTHFLTYAERKSGGSDSYIGPWARKSRGRQLSFDYLLGVDFQANYCEVVKCDEGALVGRLDIQSQDKSLVYGVSQALPFYGNFAIVKQNDNAYQQVQAYLDYGESLIGTPSSDTLWLKKEKQGFGKQFPLIVASGFGGRVAYYAFPPEYVVSDKMPLDKKTGARIAYWGLIENMYYGMVYR